jgi:hypothetical protein
MENHTQAWENHSQVCFLSMSLEQVKIIICKVKDDFLSMSLKQV